jgi:membrane protease YdiL (CAAX protease family)
MMSQNSNYTSAEVWLSLSKLLFILFITLFVAQFVAYGFALPLLNYSTEELEALITAPKEYPHHRMAFLLLEGIIRILLFIAAPMFFLNYIDTGNDALSIQTNPNPKLILWVLLPVIVMTAIPLDSHIIAWNQTIHLPDFLASYENWALAREKEAAELTLFLTQYENFTEYIIGLLIIAVVPAVGEELLFRGVLQNKVNLLLKNPHLSIWITAFIFSFIHFQFYGFFPRMLLGAMFGYLYWWSGNLVIAMVAHFINNGFTLTMIYCNQMGWTDYDLESTFPVSITAITSSVFCAALWIFWKNTTKDLRNS